AELRMQSVVVPEDLEGFVGIRTVRRSVPARGEVDRFASENAEDVRLGSAAVDVVVGAPVVLRQADLRPGIVILNPLLHERNQLDHAAIDALAADPRLID